MPVFVNRILNLKKIAVLGFDMDYTLVRYNTEAFESLTHELALERLVKTKGYPGEILKLKFEFARAILGLVIDKRHGNLLKVSRYGKVKISYHGLDLIPFREQAKIYQNKAIDVKNEEFESLDTAFAIAHGVLYSQLIQLKKEGIELPSYGDIASDVRSAIELIHSDGSIKYRICLQFENYVIPDPRVPALMERYREEGKKLMIITNSDYLYTKALLDYALNPFWTRYKRWEDVFQLVITLAGKPHFFQRHEPFLKIEPETGLMANYNGSTARGIYQGGNFQKVQDDLGLSGGDILYIGDHIYGDVVSIKKQCAWRTALVLADLEQELEELKRARPLQKEIDALIGEKILLETELNHLDMERYEGRRVDRKRILKLFEEQEEYSTRISDKLEVLRTYFNPYWGEILRSGSEESRFADQVERYACIYMTKVSDLYAYSPKTYFRPTTRRILPHEEGVD